MQNPFKVSQNFPQSSIRVMYKKLQFNQKEQGPLFYGGSTLHFQPMSTHSA